MKNTVYNNPPTLCWNCKNTNRFKCSWFNPKNPKPVDGWEAIRRDVMVCGKCVESYIVVSCPNYVPEEPRPDNTDHIQIPQCPKVGVRWSNGKWLAELYKNGKRYYLGLHKTMEEAIAAREKAEQRFGK